MKSRVETKLLGKQHTTVINSFIIARFQYN